MPKPIKKTRAARRDKKSASSAPVPETARRMEYGPEERALFNNAIHIKPIFKSIFTTLIKRSLYLFLQVRVCFYWICREPIIASIKQLE